MALLQELALAGLAAQSNRESALFGQRPQLASDQATPMTFRVLEGPLSSQILQTGQPNGVIQLSGRSLPYRPLSFEGRQRVNTIFPAGSLSATQQVMGAILEPTTMQGMWKDKYLGNGVAAGLCVLFDTIRKMGAPVEVIWGGGVFAQSIVGRPYVRRGILARTKWSPERPQDVGWEMEWHWASEGEVVAPALTVGIVNPRFALAGMLEYIDQVNMQIDAFRQSPIGLIIEFDGPLVVSLDALRETSTGVANIIDSVEKAAGSASDISRSVLERGVNVSVKVNTEMKSVEAAFLTMDPLRVETKDDPRGTLDMLGMRASVLSSASRARANAAENAASLSGLLYPAVLAEVRPPIGTDLRVLAQQYYGDPEQWFLIAQYNGITGSAVPALPAGASDNPFATRPIVIPARQDGPLGDLRGAC